MIKVKDENWDFVVIGAGPAGAVSALQLARAKKKVLLVDRAQFPRNKVCGCCLSGKTIKYLKEAGLADLPSSLQAAKISAIAFSTASGALRLPLPPGLALSRSTLDNALVQRAAETGAHFLPSTSATVGTVNGDARIVKLRQAGGDEIDIRAGCVLVADGLGGRSLAELTGEEKDALSPVVSAGSRIGAGTVVQKNPEMDGYYAPGSIYMALHRGGYLGLVRLEDGRLDIAAAFDPAFTREAGSSQKAAKILLQDVGQPYLPAFDQSHWSGTPALTRKRRNLAARRLFILGDAASYAEPFTGEGISWAINSALLVVPLALPAVEHWDDNYIYRWQKIHREAVASKQDFSRSLGGLLRHDQVCSVAFSTLLKHMPVLAKPIVDKVCR